MLIWSHAPPYYKYIVVMLANKWLIRLCSHAKYESVTKFWVEFEFFNILIFQNTNTEINQIKKTVRGINKIAENAFFKTLEINTNRFIGVLEMWVWCGHRWKGGL